MQNHDQVVNEQPAQFINPLETRSELQAGAMVAEGFDIDSIEDVLEAEIQLKHDDKLLPLFVTFAGPEHPKRKGFVFAKQREMRNRFAASGKLEFQDPREDEQDENELMQLCVLGWRGFTSKGVPVECTPATVGQILNDPKKAWLRRAFKQAFDSREAFIRASVTP